jgi:hypothetical protein
MEPSVLLGQMQMDRKEDETLCIDHQIDNNRAKRMGRQENWSR